MSNLDCNQLYTEHFRSVYNYVYFRLRNIQDTEDVVSDIFLKAVHSAHTYKKRIGASEKSWLFAIVRNTLIDFYRKKKHNVIDVESIDIVDDSPSFTEKIDQHTQYEYIINRLSTLPERQQEMLILKYHADLSNHEIARQLNVTVSTVSSTLSKAIQSLQLLAHI